MPQPFPAVTRFADMVPFGLRFFNGVTDYDKKTFDSAAAQKVIVSYLANNTGGGGEGGAFVIGSAFGGDGINRGFASLNRSPIALGITGTGGTRRLYTVARPAQNVLHHWLWTMDIATPVATLKLDGIDTALTLAEAGTPTGNFGVTDWYMMADPSNASTFSAGYLANFGVWQGTETISDADVIKLRNGWPPHMAHPAGLIGEYIPPYRASYVKVGNQASVTSLTLPPFNAIPGSTVVVFWRGGGSGGTVTVTDTLGNTYTQVASDSSHDPTLRVFVASGVTGGPSNIITVSFSATTFVWATACQYVGVGPLLTSGVLAAAGGTTDLTSGPITTGAPVVLVVAAGQNSVTTYTAGTDFQLIDGSIDAPTAFFFGGLEEYITPTALSAYTAHITSGVTNQSTVAWAAFQKMQ